MNGYMQKWESAADDFLSVILTTHKQWEYAQFERGITSDHLPPGNWRAVYSAAAVLRTDANKNRALQDTEVATQAGAGVTVEWVAVRLALVDTLRVAGFEATCQLLEQYGQGHQQLIVAQQGAAKIRAALEVGTDPDNAVSDMAEALRTVHTPRVQVADLGGLLSQVDQDMEAEPQTGLQTGIPVLDNWIRGLTPGENVAWVAPYKSRKTSVLSNVLINMARDGKHVTLFSFDEAAKRFAYRLLAVLMAEYMFQNGAWELHAKDGTPLNVVDGKMIRRAGNRWHNWHPTLQEAYRYSRRELNEIAKNLRIYDPAHGAGSLASIRRFIEMDTVRYGKVDMFAVDHIQKITDGSRTYDKVENASVALHHIAHQTGSVAWVLSQQNEEAIKGNDDGWSVNAKGGGGVASNADTVFVSKYRQGTVTDPRYLRVELRLAREAEAPHFDYLEIHPASGWITPRVVNVKTITSEAIANAVTNGTPLDLG